MRIEITKIPPSYYGGLYVKEEEGKYLAGIEDWNGIEYVEIPKTLYDELIRFQNK